MKAVEWAAKFSAATTEEETAQVWDEYGKETANLFVARTKGSAKEVDPARKLPAAEGAVREQRQKFKVIQAQVPALTEQQFEDMLTKSCPDYRAWHAALEKRKADALKREQEAEERAKQRKDGRTLVSGGDNSGGRRHRNRQPRHQHQPQQKPTPRKDGHPNKIGDVPPDWASLKPDVVV